MVKRTISGAIPDKIRKMSVAINPYSKANRLGDIKQIKRMVSLGVLAEDYLPLANTWEKMLYDDNLYPRACKLIDKALEHMRQNQRARARNV